MSIKKNPIKSSGIETVTFRVVVQCLNQLRHQQRAPDVNGLDIKINHSPLSIGGVHNARSVCFPILRLYGLSVKSLSIFNIHIMVQTLQ